MADDVVGENGVGHGSYRGSVAFGSASFVSVLFVVLAGSVLTSRVYGVHVIGAYALAIAPVAIVGLLSSVREQAALVRELSVLEPRAPRVTGLFLSVYAFSVVLTIVVGGLGVAIAALLFSGPLDHPELVGPTAASLAIYIVFTNSAWNIDAVLTAFRAGRALFWIRLVQNVAYVVIAVAVGLVWPTIWGLVVATGASAAVGLGHRLVAARKYIRARISRAEIRAGFETLPELVSFGLKITPGIVATALSQEAGTWILAASGSLAGVGAWSRAWGLSSRLLELPTRITEVLFPTLVSRRERGDAEGFDRAMVDSARYALSALLLVAAVGGGTADGFMKIFGEGFEQAGGALAITLLVPAVFAVSSIQRHVLYAAGRPMLTTVSGGTRLLVSVAAAIPLTLAFGATGTGAGLLLGVAAELAVMHRATAKTLRAPLIRLWPLGELLAVLAAYVSGFAAARALLSVAPLGPGLGLAVVGGTGAYLLVLSLGGGFNRRDRQRVAGLAVNFKQRRSLPSGV